MAERKIEIDAPDVAAYPYRLLREQTRSSFGVALAILDDVIADLENGVELGETDEVRERAAATLEAAQQLREGLRTIDAAG